MATLRIRLFGSFQIMLGDESSLLNMPPSARILLAFLLLHPNRAHPRDVLAAICWGERPNDQARACLNTALWRLRRALAPANPGEANYLLTTATGEVSFNWESDHWIDLNVFELRTKAFLSRPADTLTPASVEDMEAVLGLYGADLLEGFYEDWALQERERLRLIYLSCLARLLQYYARNNGYEQGLHFGQMILRHDPLREEIHREIMHLHWRAGERDRAVRQFQVCRELLGSELGIPPMPETEALFAQIVSGTAADNQTRQLRASASPGEVSRNLHDALLRLDDARERLDAARREIARAERLVRAFQSEPGQASGTVGLPPA